MSRRSWQKGMTMTFPLTLLDLAGAIALLLRGSHMVQTQRGFTPLRNSSTAMCRRRSCASGVVATP
jgi:hypothetical protein